MSEMNLELLLSLLFDKDTQEQFFEECKETGIIEEEEEEN